MEKTLETMKHLTLEHNEITEYSQVEQLLNAFSGCLNLSFPDKESIRAIFDNLKSEKHRSYLEIEETIPLLQVIV